MSILRTIAMFIYLFGYMIVHYSVLCKAERALAAGDTETVRRLEEWLEKNGYGDIGALRGAALQYLRSYEELHER